MSNAAGHGQWTSRRDSMDGGVFLMKLRIHSSLCLTALVTTRCGLSGSTSFRLSARITPLYIMFSLCKWLTIRMVVVCVLVCACVFACLCVRVCTVVCARACVHAMALAATAWFSVQNDWLLWSQAFGARVLSSKILVPNDHVSMLVSFSNNFIPDYIHIGFQRSWCVDGRGCL